MTLPSSQSSIQSATVSFDRVSDIYDATRALAPKVSEQVTDSILNIVSPTPPTFSLNPRLFRARCWLNFPYRDLRDCNGTCSRDEQLFAPNVIRLETVQQWLNAAIG